MFLCFSLSTFAQVGIGVTIPDPSAELDVTATNKGFLPPRMTMAQRDAIVSPATGLMIYCTNCTPKGDPQYYDGTKWNTMNAAPSVHTIGEAYGGGIVFFVTSDGLHGLIAETVDQSSACSWWNAKDIVSINANHSTAGKLFTDWRVPTKSELSLMYGQKNRIGGFANSQYWSSNDGSSAYTWYYDFSTVATGAGSFSKDGTLFVRAVRSF